MVDEQPQEAQFNFDPRVILKRLYERMHRIQTGVFLGLAGLNALGDRDEVFDVTGVFFRTEFESSVRSTPETRTAATAWLIGEGLRASNDALAVFCEELFRVLVLAERTRAGPLKIPPERRDVLLLAESVDGDAIKRVDQLGLTAKLDALAKRFAVTAQLAAELDSIQKARNCLTHRLGIVAERDITEATTGELVVLYRRLSLEIVPPDGEPEELAPGRVYEKGGQLRLNLMGSGESRFKRGARVHFTAQEYMHLLMTFQLTASELMMQTLRYCAVQAPPAGPDEDD